MCPSDSCKIYKRGASVRFDMTLLGFENMSWQHGSRSIVFQALPPTQPGQSVNIRMVNIDHDAKMAFVTESGMVEEFGGRGRGRVGAQILIIFCQTNSPADTASPAELRRRLHAPVVCSMIDNNKVSFARQKTGLWGFQHDLEETVSGYHCKVYAVSDIEVITKTRYEHLPADHPARRKGRTPAAQVCEVVKCEVEMKSHVLKSLSLPS